MKVLVTSDTHGNYGLISDYILENGDIDLLIHAGDGVEDVENIHYETDISYYVVKGNNDFFSNESYDKIIDIENQRIFLSHGHKYGVEIVNKRVSVTPIALIAGATDEKDYIEFAKTLDAAAKEIGVDFIGGYSALVHGEMTPADEILINSIPAALAETEKVCSSVNVGTTKNGLNMDAVKLMGEKIVEAANLTKEADSIGCAKLVVFANAVEDNPFMAGAFHGVGMGGCSPSRWGFWSWSCKVCPRKG